MIETEAQRRWWFATHPEFSWSHTGGEDSEGGSEEQDDSRVRPEDVDAYVDNALQYVDGTVADILKSVKRNFGTAANPSEQTHDTRLSKWANAEASATDSKTDEHSKDSSFGSAYDWARDNWEEALGAIRDYLIGVGPAIITPTQAKYPSADEMAKRLGTTENDFHRRIKKEITKDFSSELKKIGNPQTFDIGVDRTGNIVLRNKMTGREINTSVPLKNYAK